MIRPARFYARSGWQLAGNMLNNAETPDGPFAQEAWRFEKAIGGAPNS